VTPARSVARLRVAAHDVRRRPAPHAGHTACVRTVAWLCPQSCPLRSLSRHFDIAADDAGAGVSGRVVVRLRADHEHSAVTVQRRGLQLRSETWLGEDVDTDGAN
jgi:hypothetical protein